MNIVLFNTFFLNAFLPPFLMQAVGAISFALGIAITASISLLCFAIFYSVNKKFSILINKRTFCYTVVIFITILIHTLLCIYTLTGINTDRIYMSYLIIGLIFLSSITLSHALNKISCTQFNFQINIIYFAFIITATLALLGFKLFDNDLAKPVLIFTEPSHFALSLAPYFIFITTHDKKWKIFPFFILCIFSLLIQNLTCMILVLLTLSLSIRRLSIFIGLMCLTLTLTIIYGNDYFLSRITLTESNTNLSVMVVLQGWENAILTLYNTNMLGCGFQQSGITSTNGSITNKIYELYGTQFNLLDGGSNAAKLITEFGILGIIFVLFFIIIALNSWKKIRNHYHGNDKFNSTYLFCHCVIISYFLEMFTRGVGYFSFSSILLITSILTISSRKNCLQNENANNRWNHLLPAKKRWNIRILQRTTATSEK